MSITVKMTNTCKCIQTKSGIPWSCIYLMIFFILAASDRLLNEYFLSTKKVLSNPKTQEVGS